jgi:hypothetical protein
MIRSRKRNGIEKGAVLSKSGDRTSNSEKENVTMARKWTETVELLIATREYDTANVIVVENMIFVEKGAVPAKSGDRTSNSETEKITV